MSADLDRGPPPIIGTSTPYASDAGRERAHRTSLIARVRRSPQLAAAARPLCAVFAAAVVLAGCAQPAVAPEAPAPPPPPVAAPSAVVPVPPPASPQAGPRTRVERGRVSLYGAGFAGRATASGEPFDPEALTMAHRTLPFGTRVRVTNLENRQSVDVVVNDRGPAIAGRIADLSLGAARRIGMLASGVVDAILEIIGPAGSR